MHILNRSEYRPTLWRNGRGSTCEIASDPPGSNAMDDVLWRFATARIEADVPFSTFPGLDRVFTLIEGNGLTLAAASQTIRVTGTFVPVFFAGELSIACRLTDGPCTALNLFLARNSVTARIAVHRTAVTLSASDGPLLVFVLSGATDAMNAGDTAILYAGETAQISDGAVLFTAQITLRDP